MPEGIHSERITAGKLDIHYLVGGEGTPLVLIHGGRVGARTWLRNLRLLCRSYTVSAPDLPGFGKSQALGDCAQLAGFVQFVADFTQAPGLQRFYLVGHSVGGGIALQYALEHPERIVKLAVADSMCLGKEIAPRVRFFPLPVFRRTMGRGFVLFFRRIAWLVQHLFAPLEFINPCRAPRWNWAI